MRYKDLVNYVADELLSEISEDCPNCESFSEYVDMMQMSVSEVKDEFIALADFGIKDLKSINPDSRIIIDPFTGNVTSNEFDEEIPYRVFKKDVVKIVNANLI